MSGKIKETRKDEIEVVDEIRRKIFQLTSKGMNPKVVIFGNYSYFLFKQYFMNIFPNFPKFEKVEKVFIDGFELSIFVHPETEKPGMFTEKHKDIQVYGDTN